MIKKKNYLLGTVSATALALFAAAGSCQAANTWMDPEVVSTVWEEDGKEKASVGIDGKDVVTFHADAANGGTPADRAEQLSSQIGSVFKLKKESVQEILPSRAGGQAIIRAGNQTILTFDPPIAQGQDKDDIALGCSLKIANTIRAAVGAPLVPTAYVKYADAIASGSNPSSANECFTGPASWYGDDFHGRKTSAGDRYDMNAMTAAHRTLPFGTQLLVSNRKTGKSCIVKVNDRGPYHGNRVIDLSMGAARKLNMISAGVGVVDCFVLGIQ